MVGNHTDRFLHDKDNVILLFRPFSKCSPCEMTRIMADMLMSGGSNPDVQILAEGCRLGLQYGMVTIWFLFVKNFGIFFINCQQMI